MNDRCYLVAALTLGATFLPAQQASDTLDPARPFDPGAERVPIHTQPDETEGPAWAAGPDYKVRLDDGMTFFPVLGETYPENLPFGWRTRTVLVGGQPLDALGAETSPWRDAWRYELRRDGMVERYDVRVDGVEQSFVFSARPDRGGDLVVVGDVKTPMFAAPVGFAHREIAFHDEAGNPIVGYGAAIAFDAVGRRIALETSFDGTAIRIRVPAAFVAGATFPLTVDPLTQRHTIPGVGAPANGVSSYPSISRDDRTNRVIVSYSRASSQSDYDLFVRRATDDFSNSGTTIYTDLSATRSTRRSSAGSVYNRKQIVAVEAVSGPVSWVRLYFHDPFSNQANSGSIVVVPRPGAAWSDSHPSLGSARTGDHAYLAFRRDDGAMNTTASRIRGVLVDANNVSLGPIRNLRTTLASGYDAEAPCVTPISRGDGWAVAWSERRTSFANDDWDVFVQRIDANGARGTEIAPTSSMPQSVDAVAPQIAGLGGHYLIAFLTRSNIGSSHHGVGSRLYSQRLRWSAGQSSSASPATQIESTNDNSIALGMTNRPIAFDVDTVSHWAVAWRREDLNRLRIARLGYQGLICELRTLDYDTATRTVYSPSLTFDDDGFGFQVAYASNDSVLHNPVFARRFEYPATANATSYGGSCAGLVDVQAAGARNLPFAGSEHFWIRVNGGRPSAPTWLLTSIAPGVTAIPGSPACSLLLSNAVTPIDVAFGNTSAGGFRSFKVSLPEIAANVDLYWQFAQLDAGQIWTSNGLHTQIR